MGRAKESLSKSSESWKHILSEENRMIFVTVGTHEQPFDRLIRKMDELKEDGTIKQIISLKEEKKYGKKMVWKPQIFCVPEMLSRSGKCPPSYFLCDNAKYLMGINIEGTNSDIKDRFKDSRKRHLEILKNTESILAKAICNYFENWDPEKAKDNAKVQEYLE